MTLTFESDNGTTWDLDGSQGVTVTKDVLGAYAPPIDLLLDQRVGADGAVLSSSRQPARPVDLPLLVSATTPGILDAWSTLLSAFAAGGTLIHAGATRTRELRDLRLQSVSASLLGQDFEASTDDVVTVSFLALDPWWYGAEVTMALPIAASTPWNAPLPWNASIPWNGGTSIGVTIAGDAPAYPVVTAYGALDQLTVGTGALSWQTDVELAAGEFITVDSRPGNRGPRLGTAGIDWSTLTERSRLWTLPTGATSVIVGVAGTDGSTSVSLSYEPRWLTP